MTKYQQVGLAREKKSKPGEKRAYIKTDNVTGTSTDHQTKNMGRVGNLRLVWHILRHYKWEPILLKPAEIHCD